jgi:DNA-binding XRE family transcriptional regulator
MGESPINLGRLIKNARLEAGLTQDNLATQVGVTPRYIMAIENENKYPSIHFLELKTMIFLGSCSSIDRSAKLN